MESDESKDERNEETACSLHHIDILNWPKKNQINKTLP